MRFGRNFLQNRLGDTTTLAASFSTGRSRAHWSLRLRGLASNAAVAPAGTRKVFAGKSRADVRNSALGRNGCGLPDWEKDRREHAANRPAASLVKASPLENAIANSFESRDESGYIKFYPFRAMANP